MLNRRLLVLSASTAVTLASLGAPLFARAQPVKKIARIVVGFPAGGVGDTITRAIAEKMRDTYAPSLIMDYRPGAGTRIALEAVKTAEPDGSAIAFVPASVLTIYPHVYKKLSYDPFKDFQPVTTVLAAQFCFVAGPGVPATIRTVQDYLTWVKANSAQATYGIPAAGSMPHFLGVMMSRALGVKLASVPYRGGAPLAQDIMAGQVPVGIVLASEALNFIPTGKMRVLATFSPSRLPFLPDAATMTEQGYPSLVAEEWFAFVLPAKTPVSIVEALNSSLRSALAATDVAALINRLGFRARSESVSDFTRLMQDEYAKWGPIVRETGFTSEE